MYIDMHVYVYIYVYIGTLYIYIERERGGDAGLVSSTVSALFWDPVCF